MATKWFDRTFSFDMDPAAFGTIEKRMAGTAGRLQELCAAQSETTLAYKPGDKWSVKEHIGHLLILEKIWQARFRDIDSNKEGLTPADLDNKATFEAGFNQYELGELLNSFDKERNATLTLIAGMDTADGSKSAQHPRLQQAVRFVDHAFFIAEHDDHHIAAIREILQS